MTSYTKLLWTDPTDEVNEAPPPNPDSHGSYKESSMLYPNQIGGNFAMAAIFKAHAGVDGLNYSPNTLAPSFKQGNQGSSILCLGFNLCGWLMGRCCRKPI